MDDNLLNATNTAIGAVAAVLLARALGDHSPACPDPPMSKLKIYLDFARPFTLLPPALGVVSGARHRLGRARHAQQRSASRPCCPSSGAR